MKIPLVVVLFTFCAGLETVNSLTCYNSQEPSGIQDNCGICVVMTMSDPLGQSSSQATCMPMANCYQPMDICAMNRCPEGIKCECKCCQTDRCNQPGPTRTTPQVVQTTTTTTAPSSTRFQGIEATTKGKNAASQLGAVLTLILATIGITAL